MPIFGKIGQALGQMGRFYTSPEGIQNLQATFQDMANPGGGAFQSLQERRMRLAQQQQQQQAIQGLLAQMQPDTQTPQVNELIGGANMRGGQVGMAPMQMQTPRRAGLDYSDPATRDAFQRFIMAGGKPDFLQGIAESMQPPKMQTFNTRSGVVGVNPETGEVQELYQDPYAEALAQKQIDATDALAEQRRSGGRAALINANRPRSTARTGSGPVRNQPTRVITY